MDRGRISAIDATRGLAAVAVMLLHFGFGPQWFAYAVDLFFVISGYVIARRYELELIAGMTLREFMRARLAKLYPMYALGTALCLALYVASGMSTGTNNATNVIGASAAAALLIPYLGSASPFLFPLNPPAWSLFFEVVVNGLYARHVARLGRDALLIIAALSAVAALATHSTMINGMGRATSGFAVGVLIFRHMPAATDSEGHRFAGWLGRISYPLYATHWALVIAVQKFALPPILAAALAIPLAMLALFWLHRRPQLRDRRHSGKIPALMKS
jgi:peptidoglycan/LPS O-acetylase OafA/YrhL